MKTIVKIVKVAIKVIISIVLGFTFAVAVIEVPNALGYSIELLSFEWFRELILYICLILGFVYVFVLNGKHREKNYDRRKDVTDAEA